MTTPADWFPDPTRRFERRYWDGSAWTEHVWGAGVQGIDALVAAAPVAGKATVEATVGSEVTELQTAPASEERPKRMSRREAKRQGRDAFESTALAAAHGDDTALAALPSIVSEAASHYKAKEWEQRRWDTLTLGIRDVLDDDLLTAEEERQLFRLADALGVDIQGLPTRNMAVFEELVIAGLNDGRLPVVDVPIMLKPGEVGRATFSVALMKEVAVREMRGGSHGVSIRVAKGVSYRVGQARARSVVVGTQMQVQDTGVLTITNQRAVFTGQKRTLEFRYDKLVGMEQFTDGLRLNVSNRQLASLFKFAATSSPAIAAALISRQE
ncbi:hypothetical protein B1729_09325 [Microbacterium sp. B35-04]|uniref:DUF2510 domain-containing protein n=1 Tax=Microbacterium sp. B35-04 TaxID=1961716 RepID=UPI0013D3C905|nr:DUF2510 domain-containing protein [Microbacterium sp. B35-04]KAF2413490.1 hypothetical protein B1729_09325 [Microbacterium sp. B35-04]